MPIIYASKMNMNNLSIKTGVNFDYILCAKYDSASVDVVKVPIDRHISLLESIIRMIDDDEYNVADMHDKFRRYIDDCGTLSYCLQHEYYDSYIQDIHYPEFNSRVYRTEIDNKKFAIVSRKRRYIRSLEVINRPLYEEKLVAIKEEAERSVRRDWKKRKIEYAQKCISYIYAYDYHKTIKEQCIEEEFDMFSNEMHGRYVYTHEVNSDLKIETSTNFCYGSASYFNLTVTYKGVRLLPYSVWVKYYHAGYNQLLRCTRPYSSRRINWDNCMHFISKFVSKAIESPDNFVRENILGEINQLINGLEITFAMTDVQFRQRLEVAEQEDTDYIGISAAKNANQNDMDYYRIRPSECAMVYRMEKVIGALHFLVSLQKLQELYSEIYNAVARIKEMNVSIYPEVERTIPMVENELDLLQDELNHLQMELTPVEKQYVKLNTMLDNQLKNVIDIEKQKSITDTFKETHPEYECLREKIDKLKSDIKLLNVKIIDRSNMKTRLEKYKQLIERYVDLP